jgi:cytochrome P450
MALHADVGWSVLAGLAGLVAALVLLERIRTPAALRRYPAYPPGAGLSSLPHLLLDLWHPQGVSAGLVDAHARLRSSVLRTGPKRLHLSTASAQVLKDIGSLDKAPAYAAFDLGSATVFSSRSRADHGARASVVASLFTKTAVRDKADVVSDAVHATLDVLDKKVGSGTAQVNLLALFRAFAIDVAATLYCGKTYGATHALRHGDFMSTDIGLIHDHFNEAGQSSLCRAALLLLTGDTVPLGLWSPAYGPKLRTAHEKLTTAWRKVSPAKSKAVHEQDKLTAALAHYEAFVDGAVSSPDAAYPAAMARAPAYAQLDATEQRAAITVECYDLLFAATESLAATLAVGLLRLHTAEASSSLERVRSALQAQGSGEEQLLQATVNECLRVTSPVPRALDRIVGAKGLRLDDGTFLPAGTVIGIGQQALHQPDTPFSLSKWLDEDGAPASIAFGLPGAPSRACLARALAEEELRQMLAAFLRRFEVVQPVLPRGRDMFNVGFPRGLVAAQVSRRRA